MDNPPQTTAIQGCTLIDPSGLAPADATGILVEDGKVKGFIDSNPMEDSRKKQVQVIDASGLSLLPGLIDCHLHLSGLSKGFPPSSWPLSNREERIVRSVRQAWDLLMAGFTTVIDNSPHGPFIREMIKSGEIMGPQVIPCGRGLAATGGAGHIPFFSETTVRQKHPWAITCDGADNLRLEVRRLRQEGADWIKFWTSGARMWERDKGTDIQYSEEEMKAIVDEAHRYGLKVQTHCTCNMAGKMAISAGADCLVHGEGLEDECKRLLLDHKAAWLPTLHATVEGAKLIGEEHHLGSLKIGATADIILMKGRPDQDTSAFDDVANVVLVMREGIIVKDSLCLANTSSKNFGPFSLAKDRK
jgi:imidazolonepropionase-like amidohydrolase